MKRQVLSISLLLILFNPLALKLGVFCHWKYNQKIIAQTLCVNKNKPQLHCNGKCQLKKKLELLTPQEKSKETVPPITAFKTLKIDQFIPVRKLMFAQQETGLSFFKTPLFQLSNCFYSSSFIHSIFHPPEMLV